MSCNILGYSKDYVNNEIEISTNSIDKILLPGFM